MDAVSVPCAVPGVVAANVYPLDFEEWHRECMETTPQPPVGYTGQFSGTNIGDISSSILKVLLTALPVMVAERASSTPAARAHCAMLLNFLLLDEEDRPPFVHSVHWMKRGLGHHLDSLGRFGDPVFMVCLAPKGGVNAVEFGPVNEWQAKRHRVVPTKVARVTLVLDRLAVYLISGPSRYGFTHAVKPVKAETPRFSWGFRCKGPTAIPPHSRAVVARAKKRPHGDDAAPIDVPDSGDEAVPAAAAADAAPVAPGDDAAIL